MASEIFGTVLPFALFACWLSGLVVWVRLLSHVKRGVRLWYLAFNGLAWFDARNFDRGGAPLVRRLRWSVGAFAALVTAAIVVGHVTRSGRLTSTVQVGEMSVTVGGGDALTPRRETRARRSDLEP
ncbi:MAG: hypothetical protein IT376_16495 [Polyangiaceae bacterium]|nr:hypothetical protein [Polyangiaceae bacterium]